MCRHQRLQQDRKARLYPGTFTEGVRWTEARRRSRYWWRPTDDVVMCKIIFHRWDIIYLTISPVMFVFEKDTTAGIVKFRGAVWDFDPRDEGSLWEFDRGGTAGLPADVREMPIYHPQRVSGCEDCPAIAISIVLTQSLEPLRQSRHWLTSGFRRRQFSGMKRTDQISSKLASFFSVTCS